MLIILGAGLHSPWWKVSFKEKTNQMLLKDSWSHLVKKAAFGSHENSPLGPCACTPGKSYNFYFCRPSVTWWWIFFFQFPDICDSVNTLEKEGENRPVKLNKSEIYPCTYGYLICKNSSMTREWMKSHLGNDLKRTESLFGEK